MAKRIFTLLMAVMLCGSAMAQTEGTATVTDNGIYTVVEEDPEFPGGMDALAGWIGSNIQYPAQAKADGIQGTVYVTFVVERDGSISGVKVLRHRDEMQVLEDEAVRVVRAMPKWKPGKQRGKKVRVQFNLPIQFSL